MDIIFNVLLCETTKKSGLFLNIGTIRGTFFSVFFTITYISLVFDGITLLKHNGYPFTSSLQKFPLKEKKQEQVNTAFIFCHLRLATFM